MKYEDYAEKFKALVEDPDSVSVAAVEILNEIKADCEVMASLEAGIAKKDDQIRSLQDKNMSLYMMVTGGSESQDEEEPKPLTFGEKLEKIEAEQNGGK